MENIIVVSKHTFTLFVSSLKLPFLCNLQCEIWSEFVLTQFFYSKRRRCSRRLCWRFWSLLHFFYKMWRNYLWKQHLSNYRRVILDFTIRDLDMNHNICFYQIHVHKWLKYDHIATDTTSPLCRYTICKCNPLICQIRLDFTAFELAPPFTCGGSSTSVACTTTDGPLIGDCIYDTFTVTTPGKLRPW